MANITIDRGFIAERPLAIPTLDRVVRRLRVLMRLRRIAAVERKRALAARVGDNDPRILADARVDPRRHRRYDWVAEIARAMTGGPI